MRASSRIAASLAAAAVLIPLTAGNCVAQPASPAYPLLGSLAPDDIIYAQQQEQLAQSYAAIQNRKAQPDLVVYAYVVRSTVDLFSLAARLNLPYETLATMNRLDRSRSFLSGERVLVPSAPGIFAPLSPGSDLDLLLSYRDASAGKEVSLAAAPGKPPRKCSSSRARASAPRRGPSSSGSSSAFPCPRACSPRVSACAISPITHRSAFHAGIDLAAPYGTEVYAARDGLVSDTGTNAVLGKYIVHQRTTGAGPRYTATSRRGCVRLNEAVQSGMIIGNVGSTGESTGPHLHFEVRDRGEAVDPEPLIPRAKEAGS